MLFILFDWSLALAGRSATWPGWPARSLVALDILARFLVLLNFSIFKSKKLGGQNLRPGSGLTKRNGVDGLGFFRVEHAPKIAAKWSRDSSVLDAFGIGF